MKKKIIDYTVIGSGIAGLSCALKASKHGTVALLSKSDLLAGNTPLAQGGIASAQDTNDAPQFHYEDTIKAGAGTCLAETVEILVNEGIQRVLELKDLGVPFDLKPDGSFRLGREGAHGKPRIVSALGDSTGRAVAETLVKAVKKNSNIVIYENSRVVKLITKGEECFGVLAIDYDNRPTVFLSKATVLATGGCGQVYLHTTNSQACTGDGFALAYKAGARLTDLEFIQFHPTALAFSENPRVLISEAVRGEGALLVNQKGSRFMLDHHPMAELAPRDIVARRIFQELLSGEKVFLDTRPIGEYFTRRFPYITAACRQRGFDPVNSLLPVTPAAHFIMGGVWTDSNGKTSINRLFACGEVACTGVHGANRLASNSLLEGLVFAQRVSDQLVNCSAAPMLNWLYQAPAANINEILGKDYEVTAGYCNCSTNNTSLRRELKTVMWQKVGLVRTGKQLSEALRTITKLEKEIPFHDWETKNMFITAKLITKAALKRQESRGSHFRKDFPYPSTKNLYHQASF